MPLKKNSQSNINKLRFPSHGWRFKQGFTLVEMLVVVTIIALLVATGTVVYTNSMRNARNAKRGSDLETIRQALILYRSDNGCYPASLGTSIPGYLEEVPENPKGSAYAYARSVDCGSSGEFSQFTITVAQEPASDPMLSVSNP